MRLSNREMRKRLKTLWPSLRSPWLQDGVYWAPYKVEWKGILYRAKVPEMRYHPEWPDCDDFVLQLHAAVKRTGHDGLPYAIIEAKGTFAGDSRVHATCIGFGKRGGVYIIEAQSRKLRKADPSLDRVFRVKG